MSENYQNSPLHAVGLNAVLTQLVDQYGFEILYAYLNINCFNNNPSLESSEKFLKKTTWAREKVESFYLYQYKNLPRATAEEFELPPRDRTIPQDQEVGEPAELSLEDAERLQEKRAKKAAEHNQSRSPYGQGNSDPRRSRAPKSAQDFASKRVNKRNDSGQGSSLYGSGSSSNTSRPKADPYKNESSETKPYKADPYKKESNSRPAPAAPASAKENDKSSPAKAPSSGGKVDPWAKSR